MSFTSYFTHRGSRLYTKGIKLASIILEAKIIAVSDVVEDVSSHRPSLGINKAPDEISLNKGVLYDAGIVNSCLTVFHEKGGIFNTIEPSKAQ